MRRIIIDTIGLNMIRKYAKTPYRSLLAGGFASEVNC
jgi:hypothetical protein